MLFINSRNYLLILNSAVETISIHLSTALHSKTLKVSQPTQLNKKMHKSIWTCYLIELNFYWNQLPRNIWCSHFSKVKFANNLFALNAEKWKTGSKTFTICLLTSKISRLFRNRLKNSLKERSLTITSVMAAIKRLT